MNNQLNFILKSRNNRLLILCVILLFLLVALYRRSFSVSDDQQVFVIDSTNVQYTENVHGRTKILYAIPKSIMNRLKGIEQKVGNITSLFSQILNEETKVNGTNSQSVFHKFLSSFMASHIDEFWREKYVTNDSTLEQIYNRTGITNHQTSLVSTHRCSRKYKVLVLITTHVGHFEQRQTIRETWGTDHGGKKPRWKTYFLLGKSNKVQEMRGLKAEIDKYNDLIISDVNEDFYNLTHKVEMGFEWAVKYCEYDVLLKGDDDVFVNMQQVFSFLDSKDTPKTELYAGNVQYEARVFRSGKYGVDRDEFSRKVYPRYCSGGGFLLSSDVVERMLYKFPEVPTLKIDDAYVGIVALKIGIDVLHNDRFRMFEDEKKENRCVFLRNNIVYHPVKIRKCMEYLFKESLKW